MSWGGVDAFFAMGGYGLYVWGSYAVTFGLIAVEIAVLRAARRNVMKRLRHTVGTRASAP